MADGDSMQIIGESLFPDWFPLWLLQLAEKHSAVIISANYRLLPESTGLDTLDDVEDLWTWLHSSRLARILASQQHPVELDLGRILTVGDSAGGLLSLSLALSHPDEIRAATVAYPLVDVDDPAFTAGSSIQMFSVASDQVITEYLRHIKPSDVVSSASPPSRMEFFAAVIQYGKFPEFYKRGSENSPRRSHLFLLQRLEDPDTKFPRGGIVIMHGTEDDLVPPKGSEKFIDKARQLHKGKQGADKLVLTLQPGGHGFDGNARLTDGWLSDVIKGAVETWLE
jgi:acetyl esterase/lipase